MLIEMLKLKQEDDEIVLQVCTSAAASACVSACALAGGRPRARVRVQIVFVWNKLLFYTSTREIVLAHSRAVSYLLDLMHDTNDTIRGVCNSALSIIAESDEHWASEIRLKQFQFHNGVWLDMVLGQAEAPTLEARVHCPSPPTPRFSQAATACFMCSLGRLAGGGWLP
jgi:hypothetical protein